ncbi:subtilisin-like protein [Colletotrichum eremochloae]|nr:subtilisin-like protein [Colletotrichum eremochloae]
MVAVKLPEPINLSDLIMGIIEISNDVYEKKLEGKAVVNISLGVGYNFGRLPKPPGTWNRIPPVEPDAKEDNPSAKSGTKEEHPSARDILDLLIDDLLSSDIIVVTASGNYAGWGRRNKLVHYPAVLGLTTDVIVVGAVDNAGHRASYSMGTEDQLTVSAPGDGVCAYPHNRFIKMMYDRGTSNAAAIVSGVIAGWLSQPEYKDRLQVPSKVAANVKKMVEDLAYPRIKNQPKVIWNGVDVFKRH